MNGDLPRDPFTDERGDLDVLADGQRVFGLLVDLAVRSGLGPFSAAITALDEEQAKRALIAHVLGLARGITDLHDRRRERGRLRRAVRAARDAARREWRA